MSPWFLTLSPLGGSILITSAPISAKTIVQKGPDSTLVRSITFIPESAPLLFSAVIYAPTAVGTSSIE